jgi:adenylate kinase family enzyme
LIPSEAVQVIAISGLPGAGKTTLCRALAGRMPIEKIFHYDDYEAITRLPPAEIEAWMSRGADPNEIKLDRLVADLSAAKSRAGPGRYIILDTPLGRAHRETARLIDHAIWIALPASLALARQIRSQADAALQSKDAATAQKFTVWLSGFLGSYEAFIHDAYGLQMDRVRELADSEIDGRLPLGELVSTVVARLEVLRRKAERQMPGAS